MEKQYIDLSHQISDGLITYKGLPAPIICDFLSREDSKQHYEPGTSFHIGKIEMVANTGTYIDCPFHRFVDGKDLAEVHVSRFVDLPGILIRAPFENGLAIGPDFFQGFELKAKAVLVHTGWSHYWGTEEYFQNHPFLTEAAAEYLKQQEVQLVGIDALNIDDTRGPARPVHTILLKHEILIVEHLTNLEAIPEASFSFSAIPPKIVGLGSFPVRAFAKVQY